MRRTLLHLALLPGLAACGPLTYNRDTAGNNGAWADRSGHHTISRCMSTKGPCAISWRSAAQPSASAATAS
ncbi:hypothetical protein GCM10011504_22310 [Siccirubricoccus deserti]|nr:hypothetical protein GCM10011504_22310 [Siccirubricoccus deserti]